MIPDIYDFPRCLKGTSTEIINVQIAIPQNGVDTPVDMTDVAIVLEFFAPVCRNSTFTLSTANGKILTGEIQTEDENGDPITLNSTDGWLSIPSFLANYEAHTYEYNSKFIFPDDTVLSYMRGSFPIVSIWPKS